MESWVGILLLWLTSGGGLCGLTRDIGETIIPAYLPLPSTKLCDTYIMQ